LKRHASDHIVRPTTNPRQTSDYGIVRPATRYRQSGDLNTLQAQGCRASPLP